MTLLQVSTADRAGGAEKIALNLFLKYRERGYASFLAVGRKSTHHPGITVVDNDGCRALWARSLRRAATVIRGQARTTRVARAAHGALIRLAEPARWIDVYRGREDFAFPGTWHLLDHCQPKPDIVQCHNLHGGYFDLTALPWLSGQRPVVLTLHDAWLLTGHCAHSFDCAQWERGCLRCPDISISPAIKRDASTYNWRRKRDVFARTRLYVATPSEWLMKKVKRSVLAPAVIEGRVIRNGIDLSVFRPVSRAASRQRLGLPLDMSIVLFVAHGIRTNMWKDYRMLRGVIDLLAAKKRDRPILLIALGEDGDDEQAGDLTLRFVPLQDAESSVACYFQATDLYVHPARADTFPTSIIEALACGTPVVASEVGGIPEQVSNGNNGYLVSPGDATGMARRIEELLEDEALRERMARGALQASRQYSLDRQADEYLNWYAEITEDGQRQS